MGRITTVCYEYKLVEECAGSASRLDNSSQRWRAMKTAARLINVMPWEALRVVCNVCRGRGGAARLEQNGFYAIPGVL